MSGEGFLPFDNRPDRGACLCGSLPLNRYHPCPICKDERQDAPAGGDFIDQPYEDFSVND